MWKCQRSNPCSRHCPSATVSLFAWSMNLRHSFSLWSVLQWHLPAVLSWSFIYKMVTNAAPLILCVPYIISLNSGYWHLLLYACWQMSCLFPFLYQILWGWIFIWFVLLYNQTPEKCWCLKYSLNEELSEKQVSGWESWPEMGKLISRKIGSTVFCSFFCLLACFYSFVVGWGSLCSESLKVIWM